MSMEIERLTAIIESQAVTIESLSQASHFDNPSMHSSGTSRGKNGNSGDGRGDHELVSEYRGIIYALNRERDELVRQVHTALQAVENCEPQAALEKTFFSTQLNRLQQTVEQQNVALQQQSEICAQWDRQRIDLERATAEAETRSFEAETRSQELMQMLNDFAIWKEKHTKLHSECESMQQQMQQLSNLAEDFSKRWQTEVQYRQLAERALAEQQKEYVDWKNQQPESWSQTGIGPTSPAPHFTTPPPLPIPVSLFVSPVSSPDQYRSNSQQSDERSSLSSSQIPFNASTGNGSLPSQASLDTQSIFELLEQQKRAIASQQASLQSKDKEVVHLQTALQEMSVNAAVSPQTLVRHSNSQNIPLSDGAISQLNSKLAVRPISKPPPEPYTFDQFIPESALHKPLMQSPRHNQHDSHVQPTLLGSKSASVLHAGNGAVDLRFDQQSLQSVLEVMQQASQYMTRAASSPSRTVNQPPVYVARTPLNHRDSDASASDINYGDNNESDTRLRSISSPSRLRYSEDPPLPPQRRASVSTIVGTRGRAYGALAAARVLAPSLNSTVHTQSVPMLIVNESAMLQPIAAHPTSSFQTHSLRESSGIRNQKASYPAVQLSHPTRLSGSASSASLTSNTSVLSQSHPAKSQVVVDASRRTGFMHSGTQSQNAGNYDYADYGLETQYNSNVFVKASKQL